LKIQLLLDALSDMNGQNTQAKISPSLHLWMDLHEYRNTFKDTWTENNSRNNPSCSSLFRI